MQQRGADSLSLRDRVDGQIDDAIPVQDAVADDAADDLAVAPRDQQVHPGQRPEDRQRAQGVGEARRKRSSLHAGESAEIAPPRGADFEASRAVRRSIWRVLQRELAVRVHGVSCLKDRAIAPAWYNPAVRPLSARSSQR